MSVSTPAKKKRQQTPGAVGADAQPSTSPAKTKGISSVKMGVTVFASKSSSLSLHGADSSQQQYARALLLLTPALLPCSAPQFLNASQTLKEQWKNNFSTQTLSSVLQILQSVFFYWTSTRRNFLSYFRLGSIR